MKKLLPLVVDLVLVIIFCAIGRRSHGENILAGLLRTVWPFAVGLLIGWALAARTMTAGAGRPDFGSLMRHFDAGAVWPTGVVVWLSTVIGGMVLRVISGQGIAFTFVLVALAVLALFLLGWRAAWKALS